jgi:hypothetical protein
VQSRSAPAGRAYRRLGYVGAVVLVARAGRVREDPQPVLFGTSIAERAEEVGGFSSAARRSRRRGALGTRRPTNTSKRASEKFSGRAEKESRKQSGKHSGKPVKVLTFDEARFGLTYKLARATLLPDGVPPASCREARLRANLLVCGGGPYKRGELPALSSGDGREVLREVP